MTSDDVKRWLPIGASVGVVALVVVAGIYQGRDDDDAVASTPSASSVGIAPTSVVETTTTIVKVPITESLSTGTSGDDVQRVQQRLFDLGFNPGGVDGYFGGNTQQAVWAFEKLVLGTPRQQATGVVTPEMWSRMQDPVVVAPRRPQGSANHVEIYLPEQVMVIFDADQPALIAHISTGELDANGQPAYYCDKATWDTDANGAPLDPPRTGEACAYAKTPGGIFEIDRMVQGKRVSPLGGMTNPAYFNYGVAIHGADNIPLSPASHGCVRINQTLANTFQNLIGVGDKVLVWNGEKEPEDITNDESLPSFDARRYDTTTSTSTSTSSTIPTTSTTLVSASTVAPQPPPATTTTTQAPAPTTTTTSPPTTTEAPSTGGDATSSTADS